LLLYLSSVLTGLQAEEGKTPTGLDMKSQHQTMKAVDTQWNRAKKALSVKDYTAAEEAVQQMLHIAPNVERFRPHRNPDKRGQFVERNSDFVKHLSHLKDEIAAKDRSKTTDLTKK
jgi:hypothetical protein